MSSKERPTTPPWPALDTSELGKLGQAQAAAFSETQHELSDFFQQASRDWQARAELERELATELANSLMGAKSLPDAAAAYQKWMGRRFELMTKDGQKFLVDSQNLISKMVRFLPSGSLTSDK